MQGLRYSWILVIIFAWGCDGTGNHLINGMQAPELTLPDLEGKELALSSLKGNLVLIEFWAAWCKPCRRQNPRLVEVYKKYQGAEFEKAERFEILGVSLDSEQKNWQEAIDKDGLIWPYHVSDLKGWRSDAVAIYKIESIPANILIDAEGMIIGKDLKPRDLDKLLATRVK